ncbi:MAG: hypothetical protein ACK496_19660, partial [Acidobacteriota bacterium]
DDGLREQYEQAWPRLCRLGIPAIFFANTRPIAEKRLLDVHKIQLVRVLKPGGLGWLYLIENPGGLFWEMIEIMRQIMANEEHRLAREILGLMGLPANRIFYMLDHVLAPVNLRLTPQEIEEALGDSGAVAVQRLARGTDFDRIERLHRGEPYASVKYGVGENRYIFSRR